MKGMTALKYSESYSGKGKKLGTGFYVLIACGLLIVGGALWFALSNVGDNGVTPPVSSGENNSYYDDNSSYNDNITDEPREPIGLENVTQSVENEPYEKNGSESEPETPSINFTTPVEGKIIKDYSESVLQYSATYGDMRIHSGADIACKNGTSVSACTDGTVKEIVEDAILGKTVVIEHTGGLTVKYSALEDIGVKAGDSVKLGDIIGVVATVPSECNDENHLHIEALKDGKPVSPLEALGIK